jgi:hypothetical protein
MAVWGSPSRRDSTRPVIHGYAHETAEQADRIARKRARLNTILNRVGPKAYSLLVSVAVYGEVLGKDRDAIIKRALYDCLRSALDQCKTAYGVNE